MPHCGTCLKAKKPCSYEPTVRKRGLKTGYVRVLECLWGLVFQSIEGSETAVELLISHTLRNGFWIGDEISRGPNSDEAPLERWRSSKVPRAIDALLTAGDDAADDEDMTTMLDLAQNKDTELNWALATQRLPSQPIEPPNFVPDIWYSTEIQEPVLKPGCSTAGPTQVLVTTPHVASEITQAILPELPQNTQRLLNRYFALTQSWFPIIERHAVYRSLFAYRKASAAGGDKQWTGGEDGILWAILAFSATARDFPQSEGDIATTGAREKFYMTARNTVPIEREDNYSISHVQTLLILGLFHYQACQWGVARLVVGQAILIAGHIGLDQLDAFSTDHRRRTWLGCFVLDTLTSANAQKAPRIQSHQVRALLPTEDTGNEEWEPWRLQEVLLPGVGSEMADIDMPTHALTVFNALLQLLCIVNDWMCSAAGGLHGDYGLALKTWWDSLPEHIKIIGAADPSSAMDMDTTSSASNPPSWNILNLSMVYAFLRKVLSCSLLPTSVECHDEQAWPPLIHATETLLSRFGQQALPAPINLLRTILTEEKAHDCSILELIECLKKQAFAQTQGDLGGQMTEYNPNVSSELIKSWSLQPLHMYLTCSPVFRRP